MGRWYVKGKGKGREVRRENKETSFRDENYRMKKYVVGALILCWVVAERGIGVLVEKDLEGDDGDGRWVGG